MNLWPDDHDTLNQCSILAKIWRSNIGFQDDNSSFVGLIEFVHSLPFSDYDDNGGGHIQGSSPLFPCCVTISCDIAQYEQVGKGWDTLSLLCFQSQGLNEL